MTEAEIRAGFLEELTRVAPDLDAATIAGGDHIQDDLELELDGRAQPRHRAEHPVRCLDPRGRLPRDRHRRSCHRLSGPADRAGRLSSPTTGAPGPPECPRARRHRRAASPGPLQPPWTNNILIYRRLLEDGRNHGRAPESRTGAAPRPAPGRSRPPPTDRSRCRGPAPSPDRCGRPGHRPAANRAAQAGCRSPASGVA